MEAAANGSSGTCTTSICTCPPLLQKPLTRKRRKQYVFFPSTHHIVTRSRFSNRRCHRLAVVASARLSYRLLLKAEFSSRYAEYREDGNGAALKERLSKQGALASDAAGEGDVIQVVSRAFDILRCFEGHEAGLGEWEISSRCGLPRSTVSRLTHTLTRMGQLVISAARPEVPPGSAT